MASDVSAVEQALLALAPEDRAAVIERGLRSLEEADTDHRAAIDSAWLDELERRVDEYMDGAVHLVDTEEHFARIKQELGAHSP